MGRPLFSEAAAVRRTVPWTNADEYSSWTLQRLAHQVEEYTKAVEANTDAMKSSLGPDQGPDFWILYTQRLELLQRVTVFMAHVDALEAAASEAYHQIINFEDWATDLKPHKYYPTRFLALVELERIARRCALSDTPARSAISQAKLQFNYSNFGKEYLDDGIRADHQRMRLTMAELYCSGLENNSVWDPVLGGTNPDLSYRDSTLLFPYRSRDNMLRIFDCPSDHVNMADNGLFLPPSVSRAIKEGVLAIVPDLGMEPPSDNIDQTQTELFEKRFNDWLDQNVQDYQLVVINVAHPLVQDTCKITTKYGVAERELGSLHSHKLKFMTSGRPRTSFVWWSFLSAALVASWRCLKNYEHTTHAANTKKQVIKAVCYWGKGAVGLLHEKVGNGFFLAMGCPEREGDERDELGVTIVAIERAYPMNFLLRQQPGDDQEHESV